MRGGGPLALTARVQLLQLLLAVLLLGMVLVCRALRPRSSPKQHVGLSHRAVKRLLKAKLAKLHANATSGAEPEPDALAGRHKWLGGAVHGPFLFGVPSHSDQLLRVDTRTSLVECLPGGFQQGKYKWLRGQLAFDGNETAIFCLPSHASTVLKISPTTLATTELGAGECGHGRWKWHGGTLAGDGKIYCVPCNAERVLCIDPVTGAVAQVGPALPGPNKWYGGISALDGCVYGMPFGAEAVLRINPGKAGDDVVTMLGHLPRTADVTHQWHGGTLGPDGNVYGFPAHAESVLKVVTTTGEVRLIGSSLQGRYKWGGGVVGADGNVWGVPSDADRVLRIDVATEAVTTLPPLPGGALKNKFQGAVAHPNGLIYCIPCDAAAVLVIDPFGGPDGKGATRSIGALSAQKDKYQGGFLGVDGCIYAIPECGLDVLKIDPSTETVTTLGLNGAAPVKWSGTALLSAHA